MKRILLIVGLVGVITKAQAGPVVVPGSSFPITNNPPDWATFLMVDTNGQAGTDPLTRSNLQFRWDSMKAVLRAVIAPSFPFLIVTNGSPTAVIQAQFNSLTNNGVVAFQPGTYSITDTITITNPMVVLGDGATLSFGATLTNAMLDTGTNYGKSLSIVNLRFDGGTYLPFSSTNYFHVENRGAGLNDANPYYNPFWTNRTGFRCEFSGGVFIQNCYFYGWSGNACIFLSTKQSSQFKYPKLLFTDSYVYTNFNGVLLAATKEDTQGYYNNDLTGQGDWSAEYAKVSGCDINNNQNGVLCSPGNDVIADNFIVQNWIGMLATSGTLNSTHGRYQNNTFNHNNFAIWFWRNDGGIFSGNIFARNGNTISPSGTNIYWPNGSVSGLHFDNVQRIDMNGNQFTREWLTFTNNCIGTFRNNTYGGINLGFSDIGINDSNVTWGVGIDIIPTNFCSTMVIRDNINILGINDDGSGARVNANTNVWPPTFYSLNARTTNEVWQSPSNSVPPNWWFGHFDVNSNVVFDGHFP